jgi:hypothetical protein
MPVEAMSEPHYGAIEEASDHRATPTSGDAAAGAAP